MPSTSSLALICAITATATNAASTVPRGVGPDFVSHYQSKSEFACIANPDIKIPVDRVNDNSCDCPDGSDEPGTAACAHIDPLSPGQPLAGSSSGTTQTKNSLPGFWCANKGHIGSYVPFIYVNDGICDYELCCDGSEEYAKVGGVKCPNKCAEIGKEHRRLAEEKRKKAESASKQKQDMITRASTLRQECQTKIAHLEQEIKRLEAQKVLLDKKHAEAQRQDRTRAVKSEGAGGKIGVLLSQAKARVAELRTALDTSVADRMKTAAQVQELETILRKFKEEYNPNFNDEGVKAAVKSYEDYAAREGSIGDKTFDDHASVLEEDGENSGVNWSEFESEGSDTDIIYNFEAYLPGFLRTVVHDAIISSRLWLMENGILADNSDSSSESQAARTAREAKEDNDRNIENKKRDLENEKEDLKKDYGPADIFRSIKGQCAEIDAGEYTYELCWLDKTMQKSKKGHGHTNMGNFRGIDREMVDDEERLDGKSLGKGERMVMRYEDGQACWNGPNRRTDVWLGCSDKEEVWRVSEAEKCVYKMEVGTPAACEDVQAGQGDVKDEL